MTYSHLPIIHNYQKVCESVAREFLATYFPDNQYSQEDWVGKEVGGWLYVNHYFFSMSDMVQYLQYEYTPDQMFARYDMALEQAQQINGITVPNIKNWLKLKDYDEDTVRQFKEKWDGSTDSAV